MNIFKRKSLYAALAGLGALGAAGSANAVAVNPDGVGQVLIYPYYTVRGGYSTLLSVVNTSSTGKAVKVRFIEGKNSREVLDFNLYLSPNDVWTTAVLATSDGAGIATADRTCTTPPISRSGTAPTPFLTAALNDGGGSSPDRTREGYVELIEMGDIVDDLAIAITHDPVTGIPPAFDATVGGCVFSDAFAAANVIAPSNLRGVLTGTLSLINVAAGSDYSVDPTALSYFTEDRIWQTSASTAPDLTFVNPRVSDVFLQDNPAQTRQNGVGFNTLNFPWHVFTDWTLSANAADSVSAVLMRDTIMNEYVLDTATNSNTDWVMTMPTKRYYLANGTGFRPNGNLFQRNFSATGSCDDFALIPYDREERTVQTQTQFSPPQPVQQAQLCWEATVVAFGTTSVLASVNTSAPPLTIGGSRPQNGWARMVFWPTPDMDPAILQDVVSRNHHQLTSPAGASQNVTLGTAFETMTYRGLPIIGFAAQSFTNNLVMVGTQAVLSNYGGVFAHKSTRRIDGAQP